MTRAAHLKSSVVLIVAGPFCAWIVARGQVVPVWVAGACATALTIGGIGLLGDLMRKATGP